MQEKSFQILIQCNAILETVGFIVQRMIQTTNVQQEISVILQRLGIALNVHRVRLFSMEKSLNGVIFPIQQGVWVSTSNQTHTQSPHVASSFGKSHQEQPNLVQNDGLHGSTWYAFLRWQEILQYGRPIYGHVEMFPLNEQKILKQQHIRSVLAVPILIEQVWWGFLQVDDCEQEREWGIPETEALTTIATIIGIAIQREQQSSTEIPKRHNHEIVAQFQAKEACHILVDQALQGLAIYQNHRIVFANPMVSAITGYSNEDQGNIIDWNESARNIWGLTHEDVLGCSIWDILFQGQEEVPWELQEKARLTPVELCREMLHPNGMRRCIHMFIFPIQTDKGILLGNIARDITEQRFTTQDLS